MSDNSNEYGDVFTVKEFAEWLLSLPQDVQSRKIWFIDISMPYKGKGLWTDEGLSEEFITIEDAPPETEPKEGDEAKE